MKHILPIRTLVFIITILVCFTSCSKDDMSSDGQLADVTVNLRSTVGEFEKVFIDIEDVQLRVGENSNTDNAWISLDAINNGVYNACDLGKNSELLLVDSFEIESTLIYEIRLVLGENNFIDVNNTLHSLDVTISGNATPSNLVTTELVPNRFYDFSISIDIDSSIRFDEDENIMVFTPKIYTEIRQIQY